MSMENQNGQPKQEMKIEEIVNLVNEAVKDTAKEMGVANVLIAGKTGVGKSTLINTVFGEELAKTGMGKPVTQGTQRYSKPGFPLTVFDTKGLEMADYKTIFDELSNEIKRQKTVDENEHIHVGWICISEDSRRVEPAEIELCDMLYGHGIPTVVIITKARSDQGFEAEVRKLLPKAAEFVRVRAIPETIETDEGQMTLKPTGLEELVEKTHKLIPEGKRNAFDAAQKINVQLKKETAQKIVNKHMVAAGTACVVPVPFSDALLIIPIQIKMFTEVSAAFGVPLINKDMLTICSGILGIAGATVVGRTVVSGLLKFIPGMGTVIGATIAATTATALTKAIGEAYIAVLAGIFEKDPNAKVDFDNVVKLVKDQF